MIEVYTHSIHRDIRSWRTIRNIKFHTMGIRRTFSSFTVFFRYASRFARLRAFENCLDLFGPWRWSIYQQILIDTPLYTAPQNDAKKPQNDAISKICIFRDISEIGFEQICEKHLKWHSNTFFKRAFFRRTSRFAQNRADFFVIEKDVTWLSRMYIYICVCTYIMYSYIRYI